MSLCRADCFHASKHLIMLSYGEDGPSSSMSSQMESSLVTFSHIIWIILLNHDQFSTGKELYLLDLVPKIKKTMFGWYHMVREVLWSNKMVHYSYCFLKHDSFYSCRIKLKNSANCANCRARNISVGNRDGRVLMQESEGKD